jgi:hypothetical protein
MKTVLLSTCLIMSLAGYAQNNQKKMKEQLASEEVQILAVTRQLTQWMIERNTAAMSDIVDEGFTLTHITGYIQPKDEWFEEIEQESMKYYSAEEADYFVNVNGSKAECINQTLLDARIWGSRNTWRLQQIMKLEKRKGKWIILNSVATTF